MPDQSVSSNLINLFFTDSWIVFKLGLLVLFFFYFLFSLIVVRQVQLMTDTLITQVSPLLRAFSIIHALIALGIFVAMIFYLL
jgi:hypothetical protein